MLHLGLNLKTDKGCSVILGPQTQLVNRRVAPGVSPSSFVVVVVFFWSCYSLEVPSFNVYLAAQTMSIVAQLHDSFNINEIVGREPQSLQG